MSPLQGSLLIYPYHPGRRGPAGRLPWAFMSRPFRPPEPQIAKLQAALQAAANARCFWLWLYEAPVHDVPAAERKKPRRGET